MNAFNPAHFRAQFPALADAGVYLDSAATALKPLAVIDASDQFYRLSAGNVHRSQFAAAQRLTERYEAARDRVAAWLNAPSGKDIVWTRGPPRPSIWWRKATSGRACSLAMKLSLAKPSIMPTSCLADGGRADRRQSGQAAAWRRPPAGYRQPQRADYPAQPGAGHRSDVQRHRRLRTWRRLSALLTPPGWW